MQSYLHFPNKDIQGGRFEVQLDFIHLIILFILSSLLSDSEWCLTQCNRDGRYNRKNGQCDAILSSKDLCLFLSFYLAPWWGQLIGLITF